MQRQDASCFFICHLKIYAICCAPGGIIHIPILFKKNYNNQNRDFDTKGKSLLFYQTLKYNSYIQSSLNPDFLSVKNTIVRIGTNLQSIFDIHF